MRTWRRKGHSRDFIEPNVKQVGNETHNLECIMLYLVNPLLAGF